MVAAAERIRASGIGVERDSVGSAPTARFARDLDGVSEVRIAPNHAGPTAAVHDQYHVIDEGREVVGRWGRCRGWQA